MTIGAGNSVFVDTNVLVYATVDDAPLYAAARDMLERLHANGPELWISRPVIRVFLVALTRPQTYVIRLTRAERFSGVRAFAAQLRVAEDGLEVTERLLGLLEHISVGGRQVRYANFVATIQVHNVRRLLTHNPENFARFAGLITVVPLVP